MNVPRRSYLPQPSFKQPLTATDEIAEDHSVHSCRRPCLQMVDARTAVRVPLPLLPHLLQAVRREYLVDRARALVALLPHQTMK